MNPIINKHTDNVQMKGEKYMDSRTFKIYDTNEGVAYVSDDAVAVIAGMAAAEAEGVDSLGNGITVDSVFKLSRKKLLSAVTVQVKEGMVSVRISLAVKMGYSIPEVSKDVQTRVKTAVENMTGMPVSNVDIQIISVIMNPA